jgi:hypothetical protein
MNQRHLFALGLVLYVVSFFLFATGAGPSGSAPMRGYLCALYSLVVPLKGPWTGGIMPFLCPLLLVSGLINPVFLSSLIVPRKDRGRTFAILRIVITLMFGATVGVLLILVLIERSHPREGYFLWILGILLTLYSRPTDSRLSPPPSA